MAMVEMVGFGLLFKNAIVPLDGLINIIVRSIIGGVDGFFGRSIRGGH